jgi:hypothetical protein
LNEERKKQMAQDPIKMIADKKLEKDLQAAQTPDEIRDLLHAAISRSPQLGIERDPQSGQFVSSRRDPLTPANQTIEPEARVFSKTVNIGGKDFTFTDESENGLNNQIASAQSVAENLQSSVTPRSERKAETDAALEAVRQAELSLAFKRGELSTADYLRESGALAQALRESGVDVEKIAGAQYTESWQQATERFLHSEAGRDWPGGERNLQIIGTTVAALGLTDKPSAESLAHAWQEMKNKGTIFSDTSAEEMLKATENMTPTEILENWKQNHAGQDPAQANQEFIRAFQKGRISSGVFGS